MEWQKVQKKKGKHGGRPELLQLAEELRSALMPKPQQGRGGGQHRPKRPEWQCKACSTMNFMDRRACRWCQRLSPEAQSAPTPPLTVEARGPRLPPGSVWTSTRSSSETAPQRPAARLAALEKARIAARDAGAPVDALQAIDREVASIRAEAASSRPLGARLDCAKSKLAKAESKLTAAEERLQTAMLQVEEARAQRAAAEETLTELRAELPQEGCSTSDNLLRCTKGLLQGLESGHFASVAGAAGMPNDVIDAMTAAHKVISIMDPPKPTAFDEPLEPQEGLADSQGTGADDCCEEPPSADEVMETLYTADEKDEDALLAIARRLKRLRRS